MLFAQVEEGEISTHSQKVEQGRTRGEYRIFLPDNRWQIVSYVADDKGYRASVRYENAQEADARPEQTYWGFSTGSQNSAAPPASNGDDELPTYRPESSENPPQYSEPPKDPQFVESYRPQLPQQQEAQPPFHPGVLRSQVNTFIIHPTPGEREPAQGSEEIGGNFEKYRRPQVPPRPYYPPQRPVEAPPRPPVYTPRPYPPQQPARPPPPDPAHLYSDNSRPDPPVYVRKEKPPAPVAHQDSIIYNPNVFHPFFEPVTERPKLISIQPIRPFHILSNYDSRPNINTHLERPVRPNPPLQSEPRPRPQPQNPALHRPHDRFPHPPEPNQQRPPQRPSYHERPPYPQRPTSEELPQRPPPHYPERPYPNQERPTSEEEPPQRTASEPTPSYEDRPTAIYIPQQRPTYVEKPTQPPYVPPRPTTPEPPTTTTEKPTIPSYPERPTAVYVPQQRPEPVHYERPPYRPPYHNRYPPRPLQPIRPLHPEYLHRPDGGHYRPVHKRPHAGYDEPHTGYPPGVPLSGVTSIRPILNPKEQSVITIRPELESLEGIAPTEPPEEETVRTTTTTTSKPEKPIGRPEFNQYRKPLFRPKSPSARPLSKPVEVAVEHPVQPTTELPSESDESSDLLTRFKFKPSKQSQTQSSDGYGQRTQPRRKQTSQTSEFFGTWPLEEDGQSESIRNGFRFRDEFDSRPLVTPFPEEDPLSDVEGFPPIEEELIHSLNTTTAATAADESDIILFDDGIIPPLLLRIRDKGPPSVVEEVTLLSVTTEAVTEITSTTAAPTTTTTTTIAPTTTATTESPTTKIGKKKKKRVRVKGLKRGNGTARTIMPASRKVQPAAIVKTEAVVATATNSTTARSSKIRFPPRIRFVQNQKSSERVTRQNENDGYVDYDLIGSDSANVALKSQRDADGEEHAMTKEELMDLSLNSIPIDRLDLIYDSTELEVRPE